MDKYKISSKLLYHSFLLPEQDLWKYKAKVFHAPALLKLFELA